MIVYWLLFKAVNTLVLFTLSVNHFTFFFLHIYVDNRLDGGNSHYIAQSAKHVYK